MNSLNELDRQIREGIYKPAADDIAFSVRFSRHLKGLLKEIAKDSDRSLNREIVYRIVHSLVTHPDELHASIIGKLIEEVL